MTDSAYLLGLRDAMSHFDSVIQENERLGNSLVCGQLRFVRALIADRYEVMETALIRERNARLTTTT